LTEVNLLTDSWPAGKRCFLHSTIRPATGIDMVADKEAEWAQWVIFFAFGGFVGNFIFSLTDHAQNEFLGAP